MVFRLAPMSGLIAALTAALLFLPVGIAAVGLRTPAAGPVPVAVAAALAATYAFTWLYMRPRAFEIAAEGLEVVWPLRRRRIPWDDVLGAGETRADALASEFGTLLRVGVGGLWGGFGLAWSSRGTHLGLYVSRHADGFVIVRCGRARSLLVTPERPGEFVAAVAARTGRPARPGTA
jgi:hypothetical protein